MFSYYKYRNSKDLGVQATIRILYFIETFHLFMNHLLFCILPCRVRKLKEMILRNTWWTSLSFSRLQSLLRIVKLHRVSFLVLHKKLSQTQWLMSSTPMIWGWWVCVLFSGSHRLVKVHSVLDTQKNSHSMTSDVAGITNF